MTPFSFEWILACWLIAATLMGVLWFFQLAHRNAGIADLGFCVGLALVVAAHALMATSDPARRLLVASMGSIYGLRLAWHLWFNRIFGKPEDARYQNLRQKWGKSAQFYLFVYFQGQAAAIVVFSLPLLVLIENPHPTLSMGELAGIAVWLIAIIGEATADHQLSQFRADPHNRGRTCREGLWRYSRHPNYFFEGVHWWAYVLMGIGVPNGWITLLGPVLMIGALFKISGIPFTEAQALASRGEDYRQYQRTTNAFFPWFPKKER